MLSIAVSELNHSGGQSEQDLPLGVLSNLWRSFLLFLTRGSLWGLTGAESYMCECPSEGHIQLSGMMRH